MAPAFPLAKLASLLLKQISKPLANRLKRQAKSSHFFRTWICMPPAQLYHWVEVNIKMRMLNLGKPAEVPQLNEAMAIELGAELLGEGVVFAVAAASITAEYIRGVRKEREKEAAKADRVDDMENRVYELEYILSEQEARIRELSRMIYIEKKIKMAPPTQSTSPKPPRSSPPPEAPPLKNKEAFLKGEYVDGRGFDGCCDDNSERKDIGRKPVSLMDKAIQEVKSAAVLL